jgi:hypothetical protein
MEFLASSFTSQSSGETCPSCRFQRARSKEARLKRARAKRLKQATADWASSWEPKRGVIYAAGSSGPAVSHRRLVEGSICLANVDRDRQAA